MPQHLMLVPSLACPASCAYCFGPHAGGKTMSRETLEAVVEWQRGLVGGGDGAAAAGGAAPMATADPDPGPGQNRAATMATAGPGPGTAGPGSGTAAPSAPLHITFHGGEPLVPGAKWYREALPLLRDGLAPRRVRFSAQSNLWLLTDELCELFREYGVSLGTSLDGPEAINDAQRGAGHFARTMAGIALARAHGIQVGAICTFTAQSALHAAEIFDFFVGEGLDFSVHAAMPSLRQPAADDWSLTPEGHGELLADLLDRYLAAGPQVRIGTLDSMARSVSAGRGGICTFGECLGKYLAVGPDGAIYPCQRFAGMSEWSVGDVALRPNMAEMEASAAWQAFALREKRVKESCGDCSHFDFCKGGCPYNALAGAGGVLAPTARDPHCAGYRRTFDAIVERALGELFSPENIDEIVERPDLEFGLMRRGPILSLMRDGPRPS
jgi:uncharacterized protein